MHRRKLLIPIESQVREYDAKLLFACAAAEAGFEAIIGSRAHIHHFASRVRDGIYVAKSMRQISKRMFNIISQLGHKIVAWDEESLVRMPDSEYYKNRLSPDTFKHIEHLFAWGENDAEVFRLYPYYNNQPIHAFGNPRVDILRPELQDYFLPQVKKIQNVYKDFILINTNFNVVNHFLPNQYKNSIKDSFIQKRLEYKSKLLDEFIEAITMLSHLFTNYNFVVRPHPSENINFWKTNVGNLNNVHITNEGNVINWIIASNGLISNGCTTSIESTILQKPTIGYYPIKDINIDGPLPKSVCDIATNKSQLADYIKEIISGNYETTSASLNLLKPHIANLTGDFSVDKIVNTLIESYSSEQSISPQPIQYIKGKIHNESRTIVKKFNALRNNHINSKKFHQYRFPTLETNDIYEDIKRYDKILNRFSNISAQKIDAHIFKVTC